MRDVFFQPVFSARPAFWPCVRLGGEVAFVIAVVALVAIVLAGSAFGVTSEFAVRTLLAAVVTLAWAASSLSLYFGSYLAVDDLYITWRVVHFFPFGRKKRIRLTDIAHCQIEYASHLGRFLNLQCRSGTKRKLPLLWQNERWASVLSRAV